MLVQEYFLISYFSISSSSAGVWLEKLAQGLCLLLALPLCPARIAYRWSYNSLALKVTQNKNDIDILFSRHSSTHNSSEEEHCF